jgi:hypothetical protein
MPARLIQAKALLLLVVFLAAGTSLPSLDAVVYHNQGADAQRWQTHVEPAGGCLDHAEHCVLGRTAPGSGAVVGQPSKVKVEPFRRSAPQLASSQPQVDLSPLLTSKPRAPPALA